MVPPCATLPPSPPRSASERLREAAHPGPRAPGPGSRCVPIEADRGRGSEGESWVRLVLPRGDGSVPCEATTPTWLGLAGLGGATLIRTIKDCTWPEDSQEKLPSLATVLMAVRGHATAFQKIPISLSLSLSLSLLCSEPDSWNN